MTQMANPGPTRRPDPGATRLSGDPSTAIDPLTIAPGALVAGRYRISRLLGRGGMGIVYQADDERLGHPVALKFLPASLARDARRLAQFHNEVRLARQISHPNVCRVYDIGDVDGHLFLSMEYIEGEDLAAALSRRGAFGEGEGVDLARQICAGLAAVHAQGVLHRDLKPANVMINAAGRAQLMDFGIAAPEEMDDSERITEGTPAYMAPEQLAGRDLTAQSDIYALGLALFEIFTGRRPFAAATVEELSRAQQTVTADAAPALAALQPRLRDAVLQCLDPDPLRRPATVQDAAAMLQTVLLDDRKRARRILQVVQQMLIAPLVIAGGALLLRPGTGSKIAGALMLAAVAVMMVVELRYPLGWKVSYKGHRIRFQNHPIFGERLFIDDVLVDRGRFGLHVTLRGTIERGAGAGERITAEAGAGFTSFSCRIVAESFAATHAQPRG